jgi:hypothetical protein
LGSRPNWLAELWFQRLADLWAQLKAVTLCPSQEVEAVDLNSPTDSVARNSQEVEPKNLRELASVANWT